MKWIDHKEELQQYARSFDKTIELRTKDNTASKFMAKALTVLCAIFTLGQKKFDEEAFYKRFATCIANYHFYPKELSYESVARLIVHEARHTWQYRVMGLGIHPLLGLPLMAVIYGLFLFPIGLAFGRLLLEVDANMYEWSTRLRTGALRPSQVYLMAASKAVSISSSMYLHAVPLKLAAWVYRRAADKVIKDYQCKFVQGQD